MLPQLRAATASKPLFIFEFGITNNNPRCAAAPWVLAALADLLAGRWPQVRGFAWWQERWNNDGAAGSDMLVQDDPAVAAAFRSALTGPNAPSVVDAPLLRGANRAMVDAAKAGAPASDSTGRRGRDR